MESKPRRNSLFLVVRSAFRPLHAGLLLLSLLMALDPPVRAVGLFGLAVYAILVCYDVWGSSRAWATAAEIEPEQIAEPYAGQLREAEAARRRIHEAADGAGHSLARVMAPIKADADQVVARLRALAERATRIDRFLKRENREQLEKSLAALEEQASATDDLFARDQYLQARQAREEQLRDYEELSLCLARVQAQIANVLSSLEAAEAKVIKLQAADLRHAGAVTDAVTRSLQELSLEMTGLQESVDATIAIRAH
jgi:hypothetical protein